MPELNAIHEAVKELRSEFEKRSPDLEKVEKIEVALEAQETKNQEVVLQLKEKEKSEQEMKERVDALEAELSRDNKVYDEKNYKDSPEYKALHGFVTKGLDYLDLEQKQLLRTDVDTSGGFLVPTEMDNAITKKITEISAVRSVARVRTISSKSLDIPVRDTILQATYEGEAEEDQLSTSTYSSETLTAFRCSVTVPITMDMLMDSAFAMESEIMGDAAESFAQKEGEKFVLGSGFKEPSGFVSDTRVQANARDAASATTIGADDIILLTGDLKVGYNPTYAFNRSTLAFIRTLRSQDGQFLWMPGLNGPVANTINGFPYVVMQDMPGQVADEFVAGTFPIAFGDFQRGYTIVDRTGMNIVRDEFTLKRKAIIEFTLNRWNYGQVILPEAITLLKIIA